jgi:hypothetical protein
MVSKISKITMVSTPDKLIDLHQGGRKPKSKPGKQRYIGTL